jgi:hypothetical protein
VATGQNKTYATNTVHVDFAPRTSLKIDTFALSFVTGLTLGKVRSGGRGGVDIAMFAYRRDVDPLTIGIEVEGIADLHGYDGAWRRIIMLG